MLYWWHLLYLLTHTRVHDDYHIKWYLYLFYRRTTDTTSGVGTAYPSGVPEFTTVVNRVHVTQSLVFYVVFRRLLFVLFLLENWFVCYSIYDFWLSPFAIFKLVLVTLFRPNRSHIRYLFYWSNFWQYRCCINVILWIK